MVGIGGKQEEKYFSFVAFSYLFFRESFSPFVFSYRASDIIDKGIKFQKGPRALSVQEFLIEIYSFCPLIISSNDFTFKIRFMKKLEMNKTSTFHRLPRLRDTFNIDVRLMRHQTLTRSQEVYELLN